MKNIMKLLKVWFVVGLLCATGCYGLGFEYNADKLDAKRHEMLMEYFESKLPMLTCSMKTVIDYHRQHGISDENRKKLQEAGNLFSSIDDEFDANDMDEFMRELVEGISTVDKEEMVDGKLVITKKLVPFEEDEDNIEHLKNCDPSKQLSYDKAFDEILGFCDSLHNYISTLKTLTNNDLEL